MRGLQWYKSHTFSLLHDRRVRKIYRTENGIATVGLWQILYALAAELNDGGRVYINEKTPYTSTDFEDEFNMPTDMVEKSLAILEKVGIISVDGEGFIEILDWFEEQDQEKRDRERERKREYRAKKVASEAVSAYTQNLSQTCPTTEVEVEKEREREKEKEKEVEVESEKHASAREIEKAESEEKLLTDFFNNNTTFTKINSLSFNQQASLVSAIKQYGADRLRECFLRAEKSDHLTGRKKNGFKADFDWIIGHIEKILSGAYDDFKKAQPSINSRSEFFESSIDDELTATTLSRGFDDLLENSG